MASRCTTALLPLLSLLHSSSALLAASAVPNLRPQYARSAQPFRQFAMSDGISSSGHAATTVTSAGEASPMQRRSLLRGLILGAFGLRYGSCAPALAVDAPCIDVDSATAKDLEGLKGVGPVMSKRIIDYRKSERTSATKDGRQTWNYGNWATLMKVEGVSQQICANNIAQVCFGGKVQKVCPTPK